MQIKDKKIAVVALGASSKDYVMHRINSVEYDEVWGINSVGAVMHVDKTFMMDPASRFLDDDKAGKQTLVARKFLLNNRNNTPIYSCTADERVPTLVPYPLQEVIEKTGLCYFNNTVAYAVAYAVAGDVSELHLFGIDFTYRKYVSLAEAGRACVEFWCAVAMAKGIEVHIAPSSSLLDTCVPEDEKLYGYHRLDDPLVQRVVDGALNIQRKSKVQEQSKKELSPPEPVDEVLVGRHDVKGVTYA